MEGTDPRIITEKAKQDSKKRDTRIIGHIIIISSTWEFYFTFLYQWKTGLNLEIVLVEMEHLFQIGTFIALKMTFQVGR